jgi:polyisoprenoid-binding protein YceI
VGETWAAEPPDSEIRFSVRHLVLMQIAGVVRRWYATLEIDRERPDQSVVEVVLDAGSLETGDSERDAHIRSAEFLDAKRFPEIRFRSTEIRPLDGTERFVVVGDLTVRDVTREIVLIAEQPPAADMPEAPLDFTAHALVDRQELRLHWNQDLDKGGVVVGDEIDLQIRVKARRLAAHVPGPALARQARHAAR